MRAFLDTNVILEFFLDREAGKTACQLFAKYRDIEDSCQFQAAKKAVPRYRRQLSVSSG